MPDSTIYTGDSLAMLRTLPDGAARCCVTSPPYWGLRDYGHEGQLGLEKTPEGYVANMVAVFREVRRVLADDGVVFLNLGDSYATTPPGQNRDTLHRSSGLNGARSEKYRDTLTRGANTKRSTIAPGLKPKDLVGIPWRTAFALQTDGWYLRSEIIWAKPNPMPESVTDRPTKAHEQVFLLSKSARYFWDQEGVREEGSGRCPGNKSYKYDGLAGHETKHGILAQSAVPQVHRNPRTVWTIATQPFSGAHFAVMPPELARRCITAGSARGDTVLDPFAGAGTTGLVACQLGRSFIGIELNPANVAMAERRIRDGGWIPPEKEAPIGAKQPTLWE